MNRRDFMAAVTAVVTVPALFLRRYLLPQRFVTTGITAPAGRRVLLYSVSSNGQIVKQFDPPLEIMPNDMHIVHVPTQDGASAVINMTWTEH